MAKEKAKQQKTTTDPDSPSLLSSKLILFTFFLLILSIILYSQDQTTLISLITPFLPTQISSSSSNSIQSNCPEHQKSNIANQKDEEVEFFDAIKVLDWKSRIFYYPKFLTDEEVEKVLEKGKLLFEQDVGRIWPKKYRAVTYFDKKWREEDEIIKRIEEKVAKVTSIPVHDDELDLMLAHYGPQSEEGHELTNVHHDLNGAENRVATAVIYLSDVDKGGYTMFPLIGEEKVNRDLYKTFSDAFNQDNRRVLYPPPHWNDTAFEICNKMCRGEEPSLKVTPKKGSAVVFFNRWPDGQPQLDTWHGACKVKGPAKFTLQKFKEFPRVTGEWKMSEDWSAENGSKNPPRWVNFQKNEN